MSNVLVSPLGSDLDAALVHLNGKFHNLAAEAAVLARLLCDVHVEDETQDIQLRFVRNRLADLEPVFLHYADLVDRLSLRLHHPEDEGLMVQADPVGGAR